MPVAPALALAVPVVDGKASRGNDRLRRAAAGLVAAAAGLVLAFACRAEQLEAVALRFLHNHGVSCRTVLQVGTRDMDETVTCEDGREWVLFWLEDEVAFVVPETGELYRWRPEFHRASLQAYGGPKILSSFVGDGP
jgi:hypothetical protein